MPTGLDVEALDAALAAHPRARALFCVEPGYLGTVSDLPEVIRRAHEREVPVVVDQAWGAHFGRAAGYPLDALALGADAMVLSAHKTLPAWTQASVLAARTCRLDGDRLERGFEAVGTRPAPPARSWPASTWPGRCSGHRPASRSWTG